MCLSAQCGFNILSADWNSRGFRFLSQRFEEQWPSDVIFSISLLMLHLWLHADITFLKADFQRDPTCPSSVHLALHFKCVKLCHESKPCILESCCKHEDIKVEISLSHWCVSRHNADSTRVSLISTAACRSWLPWTLEKAGAKWCWINRLVFLKLPLRQHEDTSKLMLTWCWLELCMLLSCRP